ncbi:MAG: hypothetical protein QN784_10175, partial [Nitrososphaeraceae archaeon]|nr:hypothetical protein [Nitrososphaeraceae archaeon]
IDEKIRGKNIPLHLSHFEVRQTSPPFDSNYFEAVYSHMFYDLRFLDEELKFLFVTNFYARLGIDLFQQRRLTLGNSALTSFVL